MTWPSRRHVGKVLRRDGIPADDSDDAAARWFALRARPPDVSVGTHAARTEAWTFRPRRARATLASWRGHMWAVVIALDFYLLSNPLVYEPIFAISLQRAVLITAVAVVISIPWLRVPRLNLAVLAFFAWGFASALWSIQPGATVAAFGST